MFQLSIEANIKPDMRTLIYTGNMYLMTRLWDITLSVYDCLLHILGPYALPVHGFNRKLKRVGALSLNEYTVSTEIPAY
jgi:hypothetical protein